MDFRYYSANYYADTAVSIIKKHAATENATKAGVERTAPLFLYLPFQNVHAPYQLPPAWECGQFPNMWDETFAQ
jgi:hypothetical protein